MAKAIGTFPYYGGKQRLCKRIAEFIPQGVVSITDACGGSAKLILNCRYAPRMVYNDLNLKSVVGHSASMDTLGTYGHHLDRDDAKIAELVDMNFAAVSSEQSAGA